MPKKPVLSKSTNRVVSDKVSPSDEPKSGDLREQFGILEHEINDLMNHVSRVIGNLEPVVGSGILDIEIPLVEDFPAQTDAVTGLKRLRRLIGSIDAVIVNLDSRVLSNI